MVYLILIIMRSFPPPFVTGDQSESWLLESAAELWGQWLSEEAKETLLRYSDKT